MNNEWGDNPNDINLSAQSQRGNQLLDQKSSSASSSPNDAFYTQGKNSKGSGLNALNTSTNPNPKQNPYSRTAGMQGSANLNQRQMRNSSSVLRNDPPTSVPSSFLPHPPNSGNNEPKKIIAGKTTPVLHPRTYSSLTFTKKSDDNDDNNNKESAMDRRDKNNNKKSKEGSKFKDPSQIRILKNSNENVSKKRGRKEKEIISIDDEDSDEDEEDLNESFEEDKKESEQGGKDNKTKSSKVKENNVKNNKGSSYLSTNGPYDSVANGKILNKLLGVTSIRVNRIFENKICYESISNQFCQVKIEPCLREKGVGARSEALGRDQIDGIIKLTCVRHDTSEFLKQKMIPSANIEKIICVSDSDSDSFMIVILPSSSGNDTLETVKEDSDEDYDEKDTEKKKRTKRNLKVKANDSSFVYTITSNFTDISDLVFQMQQFVNLSHLILQVNEVFQLDNIFVSKKKMVSLHEHLASIGLLRDDFYANYNSSSSLNYRSTRSSRRAVTDTNSVHSVHSVDSNKSNRSNRSVECVVDPRDKEEYLVFPVEEDSVNAVTVFRGDIKRLEPTVYFNDNLIDVSIMIALSKMNETLRSKVHVFSCLFYPQLKNGYDKVKKWTKGVNLFDKDYILVPINKENHWSLVVIVRPGLVVDLPTDKHIIPTKKSSKKNKVVKNKKNSSLKEIVIEGVENLCDLLGLSQTKSQETNEVQSVENVENVENISENICDSEEEKELTQVSQENDNNDNNFPCFLCMDSLSAHSMTSICTSLRNYLNDEWRHKISAENLIAPSVKNFPHIICSVPQQNNGFDCGVYVCKFAKYILETQPASNIRLLTNKYSNVIHKNIFDEEAIATERVLLRVELQEISERWVKRVEETKERIREKKRKRKQLQKNENNNENSNSNSSSSESSISQDSQECVELNKNENNNETCNKNNEMNEDKSDKLFEEKCDKYENYENYEKSKEELNNSNLTFNSISSNNLLNNYELTQEVSGSGSENNKINENNSDDMVLSESEFITQKDEKKNENENDKMEVCDDEDNNQYENTNSNLSNLSNNSYDSKKSNSSCNSHQNSNSDNSSKSTFAMKEYLEIQRLKLENKNNNNNNNSNNNINTEIEDGNKSKQCFKKYSLPKSTLVGLNPRKTPSLSKVIQKNIIK